MTPISDYIETGRLPSYLSEATMVKKKSIGYIIVREFLYKRGLSTLLLKYLRREEATYVLLEVHKGIVGKHPGARELAQKMQISGYFMAYHCLRCPRVHEKM